MAQACLRLADLAELLASESHPGNGNGHAERPVFTGL
jgi:hypothetical protein